MFDDTNAQMMLEKEKEEDTTDLNKDTILKSLKRDQDKILNPQTEPFTSINNAYDSLIPYHLFISSTYDDMIYKSVRRTNEDKDMREVVEKLLEIILKEDREKDRKKQNFLQDSQQVLRRNKKERAKFEYI